MAASIPVRLITYNIRFAIPHPVKGEKPWSVRRPKLCAQLNFITSAHPSAFICLQEVTYPQLQDIQSSLGPTWEHIGRGRNDGMKAGEFSPIFYQPAQWSLSRAQTYWLSPTPSVPSRGWDADLPRVVTIASFRHIPSDGTPMVVMSTHLDYRGTVARMESAKLLLKLARTWREEERGAAVFLGGDFNSAPESEVIERMTGEGGMQDVRECVEEAGRYGNGEVTYTSFGEEGETSGRLDYLFVLGAKGREKGVGFRGYGVLANRFDDKVYLSDHRAVVADVELAVKGG
ncbi:Endonuclease/exonuclease/phosphatase [Podospora aff. communis PSN243]|uniref:Endonuclease/exonuclease/phosphatase n=1 Tax=Podospora aff. communis PSN243 TaxID=3040156 RepID=A0AAV9GZ98_9PEZI|nr:Endonuclease/exonuclease/phosphatase [Podospora aff. communis PSN243]